MDILRIALSLRNAPISAQHVGSVSFRINERDEIAAEPLGEVWAADGVGWQAFKLAGYALWPFGRTLVPATDRRRGLSAIANVLWFLLAGWWLTLSHLVTGALLCLTIIGIPLGVADIKMAGAALVPFGKEIVSTTQLGPPPPGAITV